MKIDLEALPKEQKAVTIWTILEKHSLCKQLTRSNLGLMQTGGVKIDSKIYRNG